MSIVIELEKINLLIQELIRLNNLGRAHLLGPEKIKYLELSILQGENFNDHYIPTTLNISVLDGSGGVVEFQEIEEVLKINYSYELFDL